jgi:phosphoserine phosphatase
MQGEMPNMQPKAPIVYADVDGTVLATDLLYESLLFVIKRKPGILFLLPFWLLRGRAYLKEMLARRSTALAIDLLPLNENAVEYLRQAATEGQRVVLASASHRSMVERVAHRLGFVSEVIATDGAVNCKGSAKAKVIQEQANGAAGE